MREVARNSGGSYAAHLGILRSIDREKAKAWAKERGFQVRGNDVATLLDEVEVHILLYSWPPIVVRGRALEPEPVKLSIEPKDWPDRLREKVWPLSEDDAFQQAWRITANDAAAMVRLVDARCIAALTAMQAADVWCKVDYLEGDVHVTIDPPAPAPEHLVLAIEVVAALARSRKTPVVTPYR